MIGAEAAQMAAQEEAAAALLQHAAQQAVQSAEEEAANSTAAKVFEQTERCDTLAQAVNGKLATTNAEPADFAESERLQSPTTRQRAIDVEELRQLDNVVKQWQQLLLARAWRSWMDGHAERRKTAEKLVAESAVMELIDEPTEDAPVAATTWAPWQSPRQLSYSPPPLPPWSTPPFSQSPVPWQALEALEAPAPAPALSRTLQRRTSTLNPIKRRESRSSQDLGPLAGFDIDERPGAAPIALQLKAQLKKHAAKVIDLFRSWDENGDGVITRPEFHRAMGLLGLNVPVDCIDSLFDSWQVGSGDEELSMREMMIILRAPSLAEAMREGLARLGLGRTGEHFEKWAQPNDEGALTVSRENYDKGLSTLIAGNVDWQHAKHLFQTLDKEGTGTIELERLDMAVGLVKKAPVKKEEQKVEILDVRAMRGEVRRQLWGGSDSHYDARGRDITQEEVTQQEEDWEPSSSGPIQRISVLSLRSVSTMDFARWTPAARRIDVLSTHRLRSHPPVRRGHRVVLPPAPPRLSPQKLAKFRAPRPKTTDGASPRLLASTASMLASASLPNLPRRHRPRTSPSPSPRRAVMPRDLSASAIW